MTEASSTTPTPAPTSSRWRTLALVSIVATVCLAIGLWLLRSALVTAMIRRSLLERGVTCEPFDVSASALLGELEIAPSRCVVAEGVVAGLAWDAPIHAFIDGSNMSAIQIESLEITRRPSEHEAPAALGAALGVWVQAPRRVGGVVHFASRLSEIDSPALSVGHLTVALEGAAETELELERLSCPARSAGETVRLTSDGLALASSSGPFGLTAVPRLRDVVVEADRTRGTLEGTIDGTVGVPGFGSIQIGALAGDQRVVVTAQQLDGDPRWDVELR